MGYSKAAAAALLLAGVAACQPVPGGAPAAAASPFRGALSATATKLAVVLATPSPFLASNVDATRGPVTVITGHQGSRSFEIRIADKQPLRVGQVYGVLSPAGLDATGQRQGASIVLTDGDHSWISGSGTLTISLVATDEVACYFEAVGMTPSPDPARGSFQLDGQVQAPLPPASSPKGT